MIFITFSTPRAKTTTILKYGFHKKYFRKNEPLTSWTLFSPVFFQISADWLKLHWKANLVMDFFVKINFPPISTDLEKNGGKSVQLVRGSFFRKYFLWNPYFKGLGQWLCTFFWGWDKIENTVWDLTTFTWLNWGSLHSGLHKWLNVIVEQATFYDHVSQNAWFMLDKLRKKSLLLGRTLNIVMIWRL